ncbi:MAG: tetraacyldisaccharide 4'-kinase [Candidatus Omnitrophica bacterium]|nr:tetraacyldisaccharide 4'-kinase [Candidatus Omnitrophota bacterium]
MRRYLYNLATDKDRRPGSCIIKLILLSLSVLYGLTVRALIWFYKGRSRRLNCRVISVGNITLGGTGKTTLVGYIAGYLKSRGYKVAILSRGYKKSGTGQGAMGDEPCMLSRKLPDIPVLVDTDRVRSANSAIRDYAADTVILDDGLQQWRIRKDLEIVTIDSRNPFGNRRLIPRGILRQPLSSLRCADIFVLTKTNLAANTDSIKEELRGLNPRAAIIESGHIPAGFYNISEPQALLDAAVLKGLTVTLFSGIGDPQSFEDLISSLGIKIGLSFRFPDHYSYAGPDLNKIAADSEDKGINIIVTTEKDAARIDGIGNLKPGIRILVLRIALEIKDEEEFHGRLLRLYPL